MQFRFILGFLVALAVGLYLPDIDRVFPFLLHRSAFTHSVVLPLLAALSIRTDSAEWKRGGIVGLAIGIAVHLCFDLFPQNWRGYALISLPVFGWLNGSLSTLWIVGNIVACLYLALRQLHIRSELILACSGSVVAFLIATPVERTFWMPACTLLISWFLASCLPNSVVQGQTMVQHVRRRFV